MSGRGLDVQELILEACRKQPKVQRAPQGHGALCIAVLPCLDAISQQWALQRSAPSPCAEFAHAALIHRPAADMLMPASDHKAVYSSAGHLLRAAVRHAAGDPPGHAHGRHQ